jgi:hypothetical protein
MKPCKYQSDGYCMRPENDYCPADECRGWQECPHTVTATSLLSAVVTCETTVTICCRCKKQLDQPKTDCA